ncbi:hypothetical protein EIP91_005414 [Steccherinum ochraceum]|uniref:Uncharacterized protein n=1 Tax=Steccherinum ochraceum TaxID=92696 RepID=A0A4R0RD51_9APHY|nr:hypothetical protein EIP91_005414 [Steccherinum ochraceum]
MGWGGQGEGGAAYERDDIVVPIGGMACTACRQIGADAAKVQARAVNANEALGNNYLNHRQLCAKLNATKDRREEDNLDGLNDGRKTSRLKERDRLWSTIFKLVSTRDIPGLPRVFYAAKEEDWSLKKLLKKLEDAAEGRYQARRFQEWEYDLATTIYELGGGAALHALHHSPFALPARTTIMHRRQALLPRITTGDIKLTDLMANIETMFKEVKPDGGGVTLMIDEIACDNRLCYLAQTDDIAGLCEHAASLNSVKMGGDLSVVHAIASAVREGKVHVGQEICVAAIARNNEKDYGAKVIMIRPTCKQGSYVEAAADITLLREAWRLSSYGRALHGPILSIASDGDPKRRPALYQHCMTHEVKPNDLLYKQLCELLGFNLWTGSGGETHDIDYKHTFKRICTLLCTREGIVIDGVVIRKDTLAIWLQRLTDIDWSEDAIQSLLDLDDDKFECDPRIEVLLRPKDAQDVPRAIKLLTLIARIRHLPSPKGNVYEQSIFRALSLLGEMLEALIIPFTNPTLSLSDQVVYLTKFAFLSCAFYMKHEGSFMPHHLYSDLQSMFKTFIARIAHTMNLDPERKVFLCLLGDDVLEVLFGRTRMIGGHSPNMDVSTFQTRCGTAHCLDGIFYKHPEWEQKPDRLKLIRARDMDHLSPRHWTGELRARCCDLKRQYEEGVRQAMDVLSTHKCSVQVDFFKHFHDGHARNIDLLRPKGGKYPGVSAEVDRSLGEPAESDSNNSQCASTADTLDDIIGTGRGLSVDGPAILAAEKAAAPKSSTHSVWMVLDGKKLVHKKTVLRVVLDPAADVDYKKSHDRLLRVRCFSIGGQSTDASKVAASLTRRPTVGNTFRPGSLYGTAICLDRKTTAFALMQCTSIKSGKELLRWAPTDELSLPRSPYDISGQILSLRPSFSTSQPPELVEWIWDTRFAALNVLTSSGKTQSSSVSHTRHLNVTVNGQITVPLSSEQQYSTHLPDDWPAGVFDDGLSCAFTAQTVAEVQSTLFTKLERDPEVRTRLPVFADVREGVFPYKAYMPNGASCYEIII